ncbi:hypothetical protein IP88_02080 [alpha proteobacterium AAP81b]|nr:hypothetical protein IP88_02080 [alpha proteobacterium AAP81b]
MTGRSTIDRRMVWAALAAVPLLIFVGAMAACEGSLVVGGLVLALAVFGAFGVLPGLSSRLDLVWDDDGVAGPSQAWGPYMGLGRRRLGWDEIVAIGGTWADYAFVSDSDGRCIYWTELHRGHQRFFGALRRRRPDLFGPSEGGAETVAESD